MDAADQPVDARRGFDAAFSQALQLVVAPTLLTLLGGFLDRVLGTGPVLLVAFAVLGFAGTFIATYYEYRARAARHDEGQPWARRWQ